MHTCPECGSECYCGGDIDDINVGDEEAQSACTCCAEGDDDGDDFDFASALEPPNVNDEG